MLMNKNTKKIGRPKGSHTPTGDLNRALQKVSKRRGESFYERVCDAAWDNPALMVAILRKLIPDLKQVDQRIEVPNNSPGTIIYIPDNGRGDLYSASTDTQGREET